MTPEDAYQKAVALVKSGQYVDPTKTPEGIERISKAEKALKKRMAAIATLSKAPEGWVRSTTAPYSFTREPQSEQPKDC